MMNFKKAFKNTALCLALAGMGASYSALAADATLNITGTIKASPCTVDAVGGNINVDLGTNIQAASLTAGLGSEWKQFVLHLKDCPTATTSVVAAFTGTPATESGATDTYLNTGDAGNVQIELQDRTDNSRKGNGSNMTAAVVAATHDATFPLQARAYSVNGGVTPGSVIGTVQVAFTYQ